MNPLLISGFGTSINVDKRKLIVTNRLKNQRLEFNPHKIEHNSIIIDGHTGNISFESMRFDEAQYSFDIVIVADRKSGSAKVTKINASCN